MSVLRCCCEPIGTCGTYVTCSEQAIQANPNAGPRINQAVQTGVYVCSYPQINFHQGNLQYITPDTVSVASVTRTALRWEYNTFLNKCHWEMDVAVDLDFSPCSDFGCTTSYTMTQEATFRFSCRAYDYNIDCPQGIQIYSPEQIEVRNMTGWVDQRPSEPICDTSWGRVAKTPGFTGLRIYPWCDPDAEDDCCDDYPYPDAAIARHVLAEGNTNCGSWNGSSVVFYYPIFGNYQLIANPGEQIPTCEDSDLVTDNPWCPYRGDIGSPAAVLTLEFDLLSP